MKKYFASSMRAYGRHKTWANVVLEPKEEAVLVSYGGVFKLARVSEVQAFMAGWAGCMTSEEGNAWADLAVCC